MIRTEPGFKRYLVIRPMPVAEMDALRKRCAAAAGDGHLELYKSTKKYDGDTGREQHGYPTQEKLPL